LVYGRIFKRAPTAATMTRKGVAIIGCFVVGVLAIVLFAVGVSKLGSAFCAEGTACGDPTDRYSPNYSFNPTTAALVVTVTNSSNHECSDVTVGYYLYSSDGKDSEMRLNNGKVISSGTPIIASDRERIGPLGSHQSYKWYRTVTPHDYLVAPSGGFSLTGKLDVFGGCKMG
jgi:hypothetical protein